MKKPNLTEVLDKILADSSDEDITAKTPLIRSLPDAEETSIEKLKEILWPPDDSYRKPGPYELTASVHETPSVRLAIDLALRSRSEKYSYQNKQKKVTEQCPLWNYSTETPFPVIKKPDITVAETIYSVASAPFRLDEWWHLCKTVAGDIGPHKMNDVLGVMIHFNAEMPYPPPSWRWIQAVQVAAAMVLAQLDDCWKGSKSKGCLTELALAPPDWTVNAAMVSLCQLQIHMPEASEDIQTIFRKLIKMDEQRGPDCCSKWLELALSELSPLS